MTDHVLDSFENPEDNFDPNTRVVIVKVFYFESMARIYTARLKEAGIPSFISNANTSTVIPFGEGGIGLHVRHTDIEESLKIIEQLDSNNENEPAHISFRDADKEDIAYEKAIRTAANRAYNPALLIAVFLLMILGLLLLRSCFYHPFVSTKKVGKTLWEIKTSTQITYQENKLMSGLAL